MSPDGPNIEYKKSGQYSLQIEIMQNNDNKNIILTGFMGTGKTTVGTLLAKKLQREFIDTDALIETRQGRTIPEIFAESGEATFRQMEADIASELGEKEGLVISTGGRFMLNPANVKVLSSKSWIFCSISQREEYILTKHRTCLTGLFAMPKQYHLWPCEAI